MNKVILAVSMALLAGCAQVKYVVMRDVPQNPSFTVFPATPADLPFSDLVMGSIIANGYKVVERPAVFTDAYWVNSGASGHNGESAAKLSQAENLTSADYVVIVYSGNLVKIVHRKTREVLFSDMLVASRNKPLNVSIRELLQGLLGK